MIRLNGLGFTYMGSLAPHLVGITIIPSSLLPLISKTKLTIIQTLSFSLAQSLELMAKKQLQVFLQTDLVSEAGLDKGISANK